MVADKFAPKIETHVAEAKPFWKLAALDTPLVLLIAGAACVPVTTSVRVTDAGLPDAPVAVICTFPLYDPAAMLAGFTVTFKLDGAVPDATESVAHGTLEVAVHASAPDPPFEIERLCAAGDAAPTV